MLESGALNTRFKAEDEMHVKYDAQEAFRFRAGSVRIKNLDIS